MNRTQETPEPRLLPLVARTIVGSFLVALAILAVAAATASAAWSL